MAGSNFVPVVRGITSGSAPRPTFTQILDLQREAIAGLHTLADVQTELTQNPLTYSPSMFARLAHVCLLLTDVAYEATNWLQEANDSARAGRE
ncbi:hypothetical protein AA0N74_08075 [Chromobacterium vaccinii]|uniref:hypothetical protein n=1 Tax=Chromobacterium vaccinii TaxID=1108595 RepID=UPI0031DDCAE3